MAFWIYALCIAAAAALLHVFIQWRSGKKADAENEKSLDMNQAELRRYRHLRSIRLSEPLTERMRPKSFDEVIGQQEGIEALKAALAVENPQHVLIYGPPGVGKTAAARLALEYAKQCPASPFRADAPFVEIDGATARFDDRGIADPLLGSVHDPIYQGAGSLGNQGVPQPKPGAVNSAHGGVLFIDEIGELHSIQINKLLKVLEDRKVMPESAYYNPFDKNIPEYIHDLFRNGLPADFRLIGATTRRAEELPEALRSRCVEIYFRALQPAEIAEIAVNAARELELGLSEGTLETLCRYAQSGRDAVNILQLAKGLSRQIVIYPETVERIAQAARYQERSLFIPQEKPLCGVCYTLAMGRGGCCVPVRVEAEAFPAEQGQLIISASESDAAGMETLKGIVLKALTAVKRVTSLNSDEYDIHINFELRGASPEPELALPAAAVIFSACTGRLLKGELLPCGELSISGELLPLRDYYAKSDFLRNYPRVGLLCRKSAENEQILPAENLSEAFSRCFVADSDRKLLNFHRGREKARLKESGTQR